MEKPEEQAINTPRPVESCDTTSRGVSPLSNEELRSLAKRFRPPESWFNEDLAHHPSDDMSAPSKFDLFRGEVLLGVVTLIADECDFPWQVGRLKPASGFRAVKPLFVNLARMLEAEDFSDEFDALHEEVLRPGIALRSRSDGKVIEVIGIYVEGTRVSWR